MQQELQKIQLIKGKIRVFYRTPNVFTADLDKSIHRLGGIFSRFDIGRADRYFLRFK